MVKDAAAQELVHKRRVDQRKNLVTFVSWAHMLEKEEKMLDSFIVFGTNSKNDDQKCPVTSWILVKEAKKHHIVVQVTRHIIIRHLI